MTGGLTAERIAEIARYCRVEPDDPELPAFVLAATGTLLAAGVTEPEAETPRAAQYWLCVKYMVLDSYDRRDAAVEGSLTANPAFRGLINQLKATVGAS